MPGVSEAIYVRVVRPIEKGKHKKLEYIAPMTPTGVNGCVSDELEDKLVSWLAISILSCGNDVILSTNK